MLFYFQPEDYGNACKLENITNYLTSYHCNYLQVTRDGPNQLEMLILKRANGKIN